jgi:hypothetical protein
MTSMIPPSSRFGRARAGADDVALARRTALAGPCKRERVVSRCAWSGAGSKVSGRLRSRAGRVAVRGVLNADHDRKRKAASRDLRRGWLWRRGRSTDGGTSLCGHGCQANFARSNRSRTAGRRMRPAWRARRNPCDWPLPPRARQTPLGAMAFGDVAPV